MDDLAGIVTASPRSGGFKIFAPSHEADEDIPIPASINPIVRTTLAQPDCWRFILTIRVRNDFRPSHFLLGLADDLRFHLSRLGDVGFAASHRRSEPLKL